MAISDKREAILRAAISVFARCGYFNSKVADIAREAGVADGTVYLYFKDKNEILFNLHELGFQKMAEYNFNTNLWDIKNPLLRLHKMGENYIAFGLNNPEFYDLMFIQRAPMEALNTMKDCDWKSGDVALGKLKECLAECMERKLIIEGDVNAVAMAIWALVHGLVSLSIRNRFQKVVGSQEEVVPMMQQSLTWLLNTLDATVKK